MALQSTFFFQIASVRDQKFIAYDRFCRNVEYGPTKNQSERSDLPRKTTFPHGKYQWIYITEYLPGRGNVWL